MYGFSITKLCGQFDLLSFVIKNPLEGGSNETPHFEIIIPDYRHISVDIWLAAPSGNFKMRRYSMAIVMPAIVALIVMAVVIVGRMCSTTTRRAAARFY